METLLPFIIGGIVTIITQISKRRGISPRVSLIVLVVLAAVCFTLYQDYVDEATKTRILTFLTTVFGSAVFFYEYILKFMKEKE